MSAAFFHCHGKVPPTNPLQFYFPILVTLTLTQISGGFMVKPGLFFCRLGI